LKILGSLNRPYTRSHPQKGGVVLGRGGGSIKLAERASKWVNKPAARQKISFGTQSPRGTLYLERIMTVVATCKMQKRNVLDFVSEALRDHLSGATPPSLLPPKILEGEGSINLDCSLLKAA